MFFHLNVHVLREMYENEFDEIICHLEKGYMAPFQLTGFNKRTTSLMSFQVYTLDKVDKITSTPTL